MHIVHSLLKEMEVLEQFSLNNFKIRVAREAYDEKSVPIFSGSAAEAEVIIIGLWKSAKQHVRILGRHLDDDVFKSNQLIQTASDFLDKPHARAEIYLERPSDDGNTFFTMLDQHDNAIITIIPPSIAKRYKFGVMIVDGKSYRYAEDKLEKASISSFGDKKNASFLGGRLDEIVKLQATLRTSKYKRKPNVKTALKKDRSKAAKNISKRIKPKSSTA